MRGLRRRSAATGRNGASTIEAVAFWLALLQRHGPQTMCSAPAIGTSLRAASNCWFVLINLKLLILQGPRTAETARTAGHGYILGAKSSSTICGFCADTNPPGSISGDLSGECRSSVRDDGPQISFLAALRSVCSKASTKGSSSSSLMPMLCPVMRQLSTVCSTSPSISLARAFVMRK